jgi:hypothetical protein
MISRKRCREIARDWVIHQATNEYQYRLDDIRNSDAEFGAMARSLGQPNWQPLERTTLVKDMATALLTGYYDPPMPKIPNIFQRLRMNDWTPPMPTKAQWPMGHGLGRTNA